MLLKKYLEVDEYGSIHLDIPLADELILGNYGFEVMVGEHKQERTVKVEEYTKPEIQLSLESEDSCIAGENIEIKVKTNYFFGSTVKNAGISYYVTSNMDDESINISNASGELKTNNTGEYSFNVSCDHNAYSIDVYVTVTDKIGRTANISKNILVFSESSTQYGPDISLEISLDQDIYFTGENADITIKAMDYSGEGMPYANISLEIFNLSSTERILDITITADENGILHYIFENLEIENYGIKANAEFNGFAYHGSKDFEVSSNAYRINVLMDKPIYYIGDTADVSVLIESANGSLTDAWVYLDTIKNTIVDTEEQKSVDGMASFQIQIDAKHAPYSYIEAFIVTPEGEIITKDLKFEVKRGIKILIEEDENAVLGENMSIKVKVVDLQGNPVPDALISLAMVDEAVLAITNDQIMPEDIFGIEIEKNIQEKTS